MPGPAAPKPALDYGAPASSSDEDYYNNIRNREGTAAADKYISDVYKPSGYQYSDPINGIPRKIDYSKPDPSHDVRKPASGRS